jgi:hypothetical protein
MNLTDVNNSLKKYTRFQLEPYFGIWFQVTCDNEVMIGGFSTIQEAYQWAIKEETILNFGF